jgi:hypothetical protein
MSAPVSSRPRRLSALARFAPLVLGLGYLAYALTLPIGTFLEPGIGFFPVVVGVMFVVFAATSLIRRRGEATEPPETIDEDTEAEDAQVGDEAWKVLVLAGMIAGYVVATAFVGHFIATALFVFCALRLVGSRRWPMQLVAAVAISVASYFLFESALGVPLSPWGMLPWN